MWHSGMRYYLLPFFETRSVSRMVETGRYPEICTQLRRGVHTKCVAYQDPRNPSLAMLHLEMRYYLPLFFETRSVS